MPGTATQFFDLFARYGDETYGEDITQRQHAEQTAHRARLAGEGRTLIVAALLHDVGQMLDGSGAAAERESRDARHEIAGAAYLEGVFPEAILAPIRLHVAAKRYLCRVDPAYLAALSHASALSLALQGGPYSPEEAAAFSALPFAAEAVRLRRYDDGGKEEGWTVPALESYRALVEAEML